MSTEALKRGFDWAQFLSGIDGNVTITASSWSTSNGELTVVDAGHSTTYTQCKISGGKSGWAYEVINHVVLSDTQEVDLIIKVTII